MGDTRRGEFSGDTAFGRISGAYSISQQTIEITIYREARACLSKPNQRSARRVSEVARLPNWASLTSARHPQVSFIRLPPISDRWQMTTAEPKEQLRRLKKDAEGLLTDYRRALGEYKQSEGQAPIIGEIVGRIFDAPASKIEKALTPTGWDLTPAYSALEGRFNNLLERSKSFLNSVAKQTARGYRQDTQRPGAAPPPRHPVEGRGGTPAHRHHPAREAVGTSTTSHPVHAADPGARGARPAVPGGGGHHSGGQAISREASGSPGRNEKNRRIAKEVPLAPDEGESPRFGA